jgi:hypothetical protein
VAGFTRSERLPYRQANPHRCRLADGSTTTRPSLRRDSSKQPVRKDAAPNECSSDRHSYEESPQSGSGCLNVDTSLSLLVIGHSIEHWRCPLVTVCTPSIHRLWMLASRAWPLRCRAVCERPIDDQLPGGRGSTLRPPDHWGSPAMGPSSTPWRPGAAPGGAAGHHRAGTRCGLIRSAGHGVPGPSAGNAYGMTALT